jgi:hypothetical protein
VVSASRVNRPESAVIAFNSSDMQSDEEGKIKLGNQLSKVINMAIEILNYIDKASQSRTKRNGKKDVPTAMMTQAATTFKISMETALIEYKEMIQHVISIKEACKKEKYGKEDLEFLIEFLSMKCECSSDRVIPTKVGGITETAIAVSASVLANTDLSITINNYRYWILVLQQVAKTLIN